MLAKFLAWLFSLLNSTKGAGGPGEPTPKGGGGPGEEQK